MCVREGGRTGRRTGYRTKNKNPTRQCGEKYIEYLGRNPQHNLLLSCTGVDNVAVHDAERHLKWIKGQNEDLYKKTSRRNPEV